MLHQIHFNRKFYQDKKTGYWISTNAPRIRAHVWVWKNTWGVVPKGYHIHHKNEDKSDNRIENLELIEQSRHLSHHSRIEANRMRMRGVAEKYRHLTKAWHKSAEGRAWHRYHAEKTGLGKWDAKKYQCEHCNKEYETTKKAKHRFCSNACKSAWRRKAGLDNIAKECPICKTEFLSNKYQKQTTCSKKCARKHFNLQG